jgi:hypothetical protein
MPGIRNMGPPYSQPHSPGSSWSFSKNVRQLVAESRGVLGLGRSGRPCVAKPVSYVLHLKHHPQRRTHKRQTEEVLVRVGLRPLLGGRGIVLEVDPGVATVIVVEPPPCLVRLFEDPRPLWPFLFRDGVGDALSRERSL